MVPLLSSISVLWAGSQRAGSRPEVELHIASSSSCTRPILTTGPRPPPSLAASQLWRESSPRDQVASQWCWLLPQVEPPVR